MEDKKEKIIEETSEKKEKVSVWEIVKSIPFILLGFLMAVVGSIHDFYQAINPKSRIIR
jgi:hypothetical protein